jgi:polyhydroxybutyrate depolymerase
MKRKRLQVLRETTRLVGQCAVGLCTVALLAAGCGLADASFSEGASVAGGNSAAAAETGLSAGALTAPTNKPGKRVHRIPVDGMQREFIVYVPRRAVGHVAPVVFMFHGTSGDGEKFYNISGWREKADAEGLIAVFPSALTYCFHEDENGDGDFEDAGERHVTTKWAAGKLGDPARLPLCTAEELAALPPEKRALVDHPLMDDVAFVRRMLDFLGARYAINARRAYASGFSNGGEFTSRLVLEMSDRFAAAGIAAGSLSLPPLPVRPISVVHFVGSVDPKVTARLGVAELPLTSSLFAELPLIAPLFVTPMLTMLRLEDAYTHHARIVSGKTVSVFGYTESSVGAPNRYRFAVIEDLAHQYPNGKNHPLVAANFLWEFFKAHKLP